MKIVKRIEKYRGKLNKIDKDIFSLCRKRIILAKKISKIKINNRIKIIDLPREAEIKQSFYKKVTPLVSKTKANNFIQALFELNPFYPANRKKQERSI